MSPFVLLLKGETNLPHTILKNICNEVDEIIEMGERKQPKNLIKLLHKSVNFNGVREFDSHEYLGKCFKLAPNCWSMPVVTLTIIALALPNVTSLEAYKQLVSGVSEGLSVVYLIEKTHEKTGKVKSIHDEVGTVWVSAELFNEWQRNDLQNMGTTRKETLQKFSSSAKDTITRLRKQTFKGQDNRGKLIAARSMDSVTQALLLSHKEDERNKDVFDRLSVMISDMLADCLTNLDDALRLTCYTSGIKERQESVREAATLVGESRQIFELLDQQRRARMQRNEVDSDDEDDEDIDQV